MVDLIRTPVQPTPAFEVTPYTVNDECPLSVEVQASPSPPYGVITHLDHRDKPAVAEVRQRVVDADVRGGGQQSLPELPALCDAGRAGQAVPALVERPHDAFDPNTASPAHGTGRVLIL